MVVSFVCFICYIQLIFVLFCLFVDFIYLFIYFYLFFFLYIYIYIYIYMYVHTLTPQPSPTTERVKLVQLGRVYFLYLFLYSGLEFTLTFVTHHKHSYDSMAQGRMFSFLGLVMAVTQGGFMRSVRPGSEKAIANKVMMLIMIIIRSKLNIYNDEKDVMFFSFSG